MVTQKFHTPVAVWAVYVYLHEINNAHFWTHLTGACTYTLLTAGNTKKLREIKCDNLRKIPLLQLADPDRALGMLELNVSRRRVAALFDLHV